MFTGVPVGTLFAATVSVTGATTSDGNVMSGVESEAAGLAGAAIPPTDVIRSTGWFAGTAAVGNARNEPAPAPVMFPVYVFKLVSMRT
jgi:hypothetical protein